MSGKVKKNFIYNLAYQILVIILPLITTPYVSRVLGTEGVGIFGFTYSIISYFVLFGVLGTLLYGSREIAYRQKDKKARSETFWQINIIRWIATAISLFVYYFTCIRSSEYGSYYSIFVIQIIASAFDISWYYQGIEQFKTVAIRNMIIKLAFVALVFIFIKTPNDLGLYIAFFGGSSLISNLTLWALLPKSIEKVKISFGGIKKHIWPILAMFLPQAMAEVYTILDKTMLGFLIHDMHEVGIYEQSQKLERFSLSIVTALGPVMASRIASLYSDNKKDEIKERLKKSLHFAWFLATPIALGIMGIAASLVPWFLGEGFNGAIPVMQIGVFLIFAIALSNTIGQQFLIPTGKQKFYTISIIVGAAVNFLVNLVLIPEFKAIGAIIASVLAECAVSGVQIFAVRKSIPIRDVFRPALKCVFSGFVMLMMILFVGRAVPATIIGTFIQIITGVIVYVVMMTTLRDSLMLEIWEMGKGIIKKIMHKV